MNLRNYTLRHLSVAMLAIIGVWAAVFYFNMIDEVYDSIDDGLENDKLLIIQKAAEDSSLLGKSTFEERHYSIRSMPDSLAVLVKDVYTDTLFFMKNEMDLEPVRMLTSAFMQNGNYYELKVISSMVEEDDLVEDLLYAVIWLYVILLLSIIVVNTLVLKKVWRPFYALLDALRTFRLSKQQMIETPATEVKEFRLLNEAVRQMVDHTLQAYGLHKQFIENASHELQTPVAVSINKLELLAERGDLPEAASHELARVIETLERLARLNKSLLLLSRIENRQFDADEPVSINAIVSKLVEDLGDLAGFKDVRLLYTERAALQHSMDKGLAVVLVTNVVKNAIIHNTPGGFAEVIVDAHALTVRNAGTGRPLDDARIFDRFYKETGEKGGTGLGLAIVKAIAALYGLQVTYRYADNAHEIAIYFPS